MLIRNTRAQQAFPQCVHKLDLLLKQQRAGCRYTASRMYKVLEYLKVDAENIKHQGAGTLLFLSSRP